MSLSNRFLRRAGLLICGAVVAGYAWAQDAVPEVRAQHAARYMISAQLPDGLFRYEYDFVTARYSSKNNDVRQGGAGFALGQYFLQTGDPAAGEALRRAIAAYDRYSIDFSQGRLLSVSGKVTRAKVGATALALLSELYYQQRSGDQRYALTRRAWLNGILALQAADGGFEAYPHSGKQSSYSNGEAWLALARYHAVFPEDGASAAALAKSDGKMVDYYRLHPDVGFFHWGEMAAAERFKTSGDQRFAVFALDQAAQYVDKLRPRVSSRSNSCYSVEGLLSALEVAGKVGGSGELSARLEERLRAEMVKNGRLQIGPKQERIVFGPGRYLVSPDLRRMAGAFLNGRARPQVRIDSTQHCLSAFLRYGNYVNR